MAFKIFIFNLSQICKKNQKAWCDSYLMFFGVGVSCRILYSFVGYLYISCSGLITSVREERANLSAIVCL